MFCFIICPKASPGFVISYAAKSESGNLEAHHYHTETSHRSYINTEKVLIQRTRNVASARI